MKGSGRLSRPTAELSLVAFTLALQMTSGALFFLEVLFPLWVGDVEADAAAELRAIVLWILAGSAVIGLLLSFNHLGRPQRAHRALKKVKSSWLSREVWLVVIYTTGLILTAVLASLPGSAGIASRFSGMAAAGAGLVLIYVMAQVYRLQTVPGWDSSATLLAFICSAALLGGLWLGATVAVAWLFFLGLEGALLSSDLLRLTLRVVGMAGILVVGIEFVVVPALEQAAIRKNALSNGHNGGAYEQQADEQQAAAQRLRIRFILAAAGVLLLNGFVSAQTFSLEARIQIVLVTLASFGLALASEVLGRVQFYMVPQKREL